MPTWKYTAAFMRGVVLGLESTYAKPWFLACHMILSLYIGAMCFRDGWWMLGIVFAIGVPLMQLWFYWLRRQRD